MLDLFHFLERVIRENPFEFRYEPAASEVVPVVLVEVFGLDVVARVSGVAAWP